MIQIQTEIDFNDSSIVVGDRPKKLTDDLMNKLLTEVANNISEMDVCYGSVDDIVGDLKSCNLYDDGYQIAKNLESKGYDIDSDFVTFLDLISFDLYKELKEYQKRWVKLKQLKPKFKVGDKLDKTSNIFRLEGNEFHVNDIYEESGEYVISYDRNKNGGRILPFELVDDSFILSK